MGWQETLTAGLQKIGKKAGKAFDMGKAKVEELQIEMQMDGLAKKLGYLTFDADRGRKVDEDSRVKLLSDLTRLEGELEKVKAEAKAAAEKGKAEPEAAADKAAKATKP